MTAQFHQIVDFLRQLDAKLTFRNKALLYLIGGSAITLAYDHQNRTADLDIIDPPKELVKKGGPTTALARQHHVHISAVDLINFSVPEDWRAHCHPHDLNLKNIVLMIPCLEDIILGKLARMEPKDFEDIFSLYNQHLLDPKKLLIRLQQNKKELKEMTYRQNAKLLFQEIFHLKLIFEKGDLRIAKG